MWSCFRDGEKIDQIEQDIAADFGFAQVVPVSGQTYSRKVDFQVLSALSGVAQTASKFSYDLRLLQSFKEMEEPFEDAADRLLRDGLQAQPHAQRAHHRAQPLRDGGPAERRRHRGHAVV